jgi:hypothetical protein
MHHYADNERNTQRRGAEHIPHVHLRLLLSLKRRRYAVMRGTRREEEQSIQSRLLLSLKRRQY